MKHSSTLIESRIAWCRFQQTQAATQDEAQRYRDEEEGLLDAMLGRNRMAMYGQGEESRRDNYLIGLREGQKLLELQQRDGRNPSGLSKLKQWWGAGDSL